ncbi:hypothetical protein VNO77_19859 [Canavalia gladiata]|uniref:Uncharacterized protein n=1 Tax=Canavalia gladiata TaxID=3824 RepID=A0AAN9LN97_CANGL
MRRGPLSRRQQLNRELLRSILFARIRLDFLEMIYSMKVVSEVPSIVNTKHKELRCEDEPPPRRVGASNAFRAFSILIPNDGGGMECCKIEDVVHVPFLIRDQNLHHLLWLRLLTSNFTIINRGMCVVLTRIRRCEKNESRDVRLLHSEIKLGSKRYRPRGSLFQNLRREKKSEKPSP